MPTTPPDNMNDNLRGIHRLGSATSELFSRVYAGLKRRSQPGNGDTTHIITQQVHERNRQLREMLKQRDADIDRLYSILNSIQDGIIMQDTEGRVLMTNPAAQTLLGNMKYFWQSELGIWFQRFREFTSDGTEVALVGRSERFEIQDKILAVQMAIVSDSDNQRIGTLMILRDVTRDALAERLKNNIITTISHELKTPMNVMRIASEILLSQQEDAPPNRKMLEKLSKNIDVLDRMIIELLDISEMSSGSFDIHRAQVDIEALIEDVVISFKADVLKAKLEVRQMIRNPGKLHLTGDAPRLKWAIGHLLRNAISYTESGGSILLAAKIEEGQIVVKFKDTGVGIRPEDLPRIFDLFERGEARNHSGKRLDPRGLGQGLFIAQKVAEAHGGALTVESQLYQGSLFTLSLPVHFPPALPA